MKLIKLKCENCGAMLEVNKDLDKINCNFCGQEILIDDEASQIRRVEDAKLQARKANHEQTIKEKKDLEDLNAVDNFKKSKLSKVLIIFAFLCLLFAFTIDFNFATIIAIVQTGLFITSYLMGMQIIKEPFKKFHVILAIIGFILIIPFLSLFRTNGGSKDKIDWDDMLLGEMLPEPSSNVGHLYTNSNDELFMNLDDVTDKDFYNYVKETKEKGFTVDILEESEHDYEAFNKDGYSIDLSHYSDSLSLTLKAPMKMTENAWSDNSLSSLLPVPSSNYGKVDYETENTYTYFASKMNKEEFNNYINSVKEKGFTSDYEKQDDYYRAKNNDGYQVSLEYKGFDTVKIEINAPKDEEETKEEEKESEIKEETKKEETTKNDSKELRSDFKKAMDSYEKFIDEYVKFMKKYQKDPTNTKLLKDYTSYLQKYDKFVKDFEKWESKDLNAAEEAYYLKVLNRVEKKLIDANIN